MEIIELIKELLSYDRISLYIIAGILSLEVAFRLIPTKRDISIINIIHRVIEIIPNRSKKFKNGRDSLFKRVIKRQLDID